MCRGFYICVSKNRSARHRRAAVAIVAPLVRETMATPPPGGRFYNLTPCKSAYLFAGTVKPTPPNALQVGHFPRCGDGEDQQSVPSIKTDISPKRSFCISGILQKADNPFLVAISRKATLLLFAAGAALIIYNRKSALYVEIAQSRELELR